ncbi:Myc-type basic helix-loop-helix (bHLH) domain-containing protein [Dioscorea alata]|uniref:Myc-type basic helix-loop-helix (BHLH) domain-containing protein n=1 Tax=Dioscorea alata TaxID=55571 RepID=A0ACB7W837_DIOAL|nr:Myc-type basic helix-loop-helix (bHLH) domain-containing protein [Dioscorea alata]
MTPNQSPSMVDDANVIAENMAGEALPNRKNNGKIPKKIHKAEREKLKRDHLNELFLELGHVLEPSRQNNGKACILGDATRLLRDLIAQVKSLRKENAALVSESSYVTVEKNELKDENSVLEAEIERLQNELRGRLQTDSAPPQTTTVTSAQPMQQPPLVGPLFVVPLHQGIHQEIEPCNEAEAAPKPPTLVRRPQARYPAPSDSWPLELLSRHQHSASSSSATSNSGD